jgi:ABC-type antimicrobial peptide transport system permease subunit
MFSFIVLLFSYILNNFLSSLYIKSRLPRSLKNTLIRPLKTCLDYIISKLDTRESGSISTLDLIDLSVKNLKKKKARTFITIGGMSLGISAIVFLVSIGYGLQALVNSKVARLDELKQTEVNIQPGSPLKINQKTVDSMKELNQVKSAYPLISVVAKINFNNSATDTAAYGVVNNYFDESAIRAVEGGFFSVKQVSVQEEDTEDGEVAGLATQDREDELGKAIQTTNFAIEPNAWVRVRKEPDTKSEILGYTKRSEGSLNGEVYWGSEYDGTDGKNGIDSSGKPLGRWIKAKVYLWKQEGGSFIPLEEKEGGSQVQTEGYFATINTVINYSSELNNNASVLGDTTTATSEPDPEGTAKKLTITAGDTPGFVRILEESQQAEENIVNRIPLGDGAKREAVVNTALLEVLGITKSTAIGSKYNASFIITGDLLEDKQQKVESEFAEYTVVGVIEDQNIPLMYISIEDLKSLGIQNFSQVRVVAEDKKYLETIRSQVGAMGYSTSSVADTVKQIDALFTTVRFFLGAIGFVALFVASLGMFNTLTVSLLERIREVGLLKAMGMRSSEVEKLFLAESVMMGVFGGLLGIIVGYLFGKLLGVLLSAFSLIKGSGTVDITYLPLSFVLVIILLSTTVGLLTGIFPAKRAKKISALNALRYE